MTLKLCDEAGTKTKISLNIQGRKLPSETEVEPGTTLAQLKKRESLVEHEIRVNGQAVEDGYVFQENDWVLALVRAVSGGRCA